MSLMEQFIAARGGPILHEGRELCWTFSLPVGTGDTVRVRFRDFVRDPVQGLAVDCDGCGVIIAGSAAEKFQIWTDNAPESFDIKVRRANPGARLNFLNVWATHRTAL